MKIINFFRLQVLIFACSMSINYAMDTNVETFIANINALENKAQAINYCKSINKKINSVFNHTAVKNNPQLLNLLQQFRNFSSVKQTSISDRLEQQRLDEQRRLEEQHRQEQQHQQPQAQHKPPVQHEQNNQPKQEPVLDAKDPQGVEDKKAEPHEKLKECPVCLDDKNEKDCLQLSCNHTFCKTCLMHVFNTAIDTDKSTKHLTCPNHICNKQLTNQDIQNILDNDNKKFNAYLDLAAKEWLNKQGKCTKHCLTTNCKWSYLKEDNLANVNYKCPGCNKQYCSNCLFPHSANVSCEQAEKDRKPSDKTTEQWMAENSRPCPQCGTKIEKNGGCFWVTCFHCGKGFCYNCFNTDPLHHVWECKEKPHPNPYLKH
jgi:hypothetical protein